MKYFVISDQTASTNELTDLDITKYLLSKLIKDHNGIKRMTQVPYRDERLVSELLEFFRGAGWIKHNTNGTYVVTMKGKKNNRIISKLFNQPTCHGWYGGILLQNTSYFCKEKKCPTLLEP